MAQPATNGSPIILVAERISRVRVMAPAEVSPLITAIVLREHTRRQLAQIAKEQGVVGWHGMRKEQLIQALLDKGITKLPSRRTRSPRRPQSHGSQGVESPRRGGSSNGAGAKQRTKGPQLGEGSRRSAEPRAPQTDPAVSEQIQREQAERERLKDLSSIHASAPAVGPNGKPVKPTRVRHRDRIALLVRDPYWLQASWEITRKSVERVRAALAEHWHTARPRLRLIEVNAGPTTNTSERVVREIAVHGGVCNWYIDLQGPPRSYRVDIGYQADNGRFVALARSNAVTTPSPGASDALDQNWSDIAQDYERVFAMSGGFSDPASNADLKDLFEERLRRPMGASMVGKYGVGKETHLFGRPSFAFHVDCELIIYGQTLPGARVTLAGEPVKLRPDGTFTVRRKMPDRREVLPVVADSADGLEQRTVILAVERNKKVMEPLTREPTDPL